MLKALDRNRAELTGARAALHGKTRAQLVQMIEGQIKRRDCWR
jgi:hypothetical protein